MVLKHRRRKLFYFAEPLRLPPKRMPSNRCGLYARANTAVSHLETFSFISGSRNASTSASERHSAQGNPASMMASRIRRWFSFMAPRLTLSSIKMASFIPLLVALPGQKISRSGQPYFVPMRLSLLMKLICRRPSLGL